MIRPVALAEMGPPATAGKAGAEGLDELALAIEDSNCILALAIATNSVRNINAAFRVLVHVHT